MGVPQLRLRTLWLRLRRIWLRRSTLRLRGIRLRSPSYGGNDRYYRDAWFGLRGATGGVRILYLRTRLLGRRLRACRLLGWLRIRLALGKVGRLNSVDGYSY